MKENSTAIVAILDASGSMSSLAQETIQGFNKFLDDQRKLPGEATLTLAIFSDSEKYKLVYNVVPLDAVAPLNGTVYRTSGYTALYDAVARTIDSVGAHLASKPEEERPSKVLVLIMTDGQENHSVEFKNNPQAIKDRITHQTEKYSWEFVFIGANINAFEVGQSIGVAATQSYNYTASHAGTTQVFGNISLGTAKFRRSAMGAAYSMPDPTIIDPVDPVVDSDPIDVNATSGAAQIPTLQIPAFDVSGLDITKLKGSTSKKSSSRRTTLAKKSHPKK